MKHKLLILPPPPPEKIAARRLSLKKTLFLLPVAVLLTVCGGGSVPPAETVYTTTVTGTVTGIVPDRPMNVLLPGATVSAFTKPEPTTPATTTTTGLGGTFSLQVTHAGSFTLTVAKTCYQAAPAQTITAGGSGPYDAKTIALTLVPEPTGNDRFTLKQNPGTAANPTYTLTVNCVRTVTPGEFASDPSAAPTSITSNTRLAGRLGSTNLNQRVTAIELPDTLRTIGNRAFYDHIGITGEFTIPAAVESIDVAAFQRLGQIGKPRLRFAQDSQLKTIGNVAFLYAQISAMPPLPQSLETISLRAFDQAFTAAAGPSLSNFVIPANVTSVGNSAFGSTTFSGTLTIRSPHLTRDPTDTTQTRTGRLGSSIFTEGGATVTQEFTKIVIPREVFTTYTQTDLNAIFGPGGNYVDLADGTTTLDITTLTP